MCARGRRGAWAGAAAGVVQRRVAVAVSKRDHFVLAGSHLDLLRRPSDRAWRCGDGRQRQLLSGSRRDGCVHETMKMWDNFD